MNVLSDEDFAARLAYELKMLRREEPSFSPVKNDIRNLRGFILGTELYDGGVFEIEIEIPRDYPYRPPKVRWLTNTWHPNIHNKNVCVGILGKDWSPSNSLVDVIETLRILLAAPNPNDPLNRQAARELRENIDQFKTRVQEHVSKHATWNKLSNKKK